MHRTLKRLKNDPRYESFINALRAQGWLDWLDWQITLALFNHTLSYKASVMMNGQRFSSPKEEMSLVKKAFESIYKLDENDTYLEIPLAYFFNGDLEFQLRQAAFVTLKNWGLNGENRHFPILIPYGNS